MPSYAATCARLAPSPTACRLAGAGDVEGDQKRMADHRPSILLLDLHMPGGGSLPALRAIRDASPATGVLILTATGR